MQRSDAIRLVGLLVSVGHGWTDTHVESYTAELVRLNDAEAAEAAIMRIIRTWDKPVRVPVGVILAEYQIDAGRRETEMRKLGRHENIVTFDEGIRLAWNAYRQAALDDGKMPDVRLFNRWIAELR